MGLANLCNVAPWDEVCPQPDAGHPQVLFDKRGWETGRRVSHRRLRPASTLPIPRRRVHGVPKLGVAKVGGVRDMLQLFRHI
jgi:hypothetical protein